MRAFPWGPCMQPSSAPLTRMRYAVDTRDVLCALVPRLLLDGVSPCADPANVNQHLTNVYDG